MEGNGALLSIRLIDTIDGRLVDGDTTFKYIALSYVWGQRRQYRLERNTFAVLHKNGSIIENSTRLSWTIKDAIAVCRQLDKRYLWIDSLCIQQDDPAYKIDQIMNIDQIYGQAKSTIVNAGHPSPFYSKRMNADSPLSGVRPNTRQVFQCTAETDSFFLLMNSCLRLQDDLDLSEWRKRAWTFQEDCLSRALLIFTNSQCFLQYGKRLFCEDMILETDKIEDTLIPLTYNTTRLYHCKADADDIGELDLEDYCLIIESYIERNLTFEEDAIKAVSGMLRRFSDKLDRRNSRLICGHPSAAFDYSLCWTTNLLYTNSRRDNFPSWSWASHKHHIDFDLGHQYSKQRTLTLRGPMAISLYTDALSDGHFTLNELLLEHISVDLLPIKQSDIDIQSYYRSHKLDMAKNLERELHFSTTWVKLRG